MNNGKWAVINRATHEVVAGYTDTYDQADVMRQIVAGPDGARTHSVVQLAEFSRYREASHMVGFVQTKEVVAHV